MARHYVFATQTQAQACVDRINARARTVYGAQGYQIDTQGGIVGRSASDGTLQPSAQRTLTWDVPRWRLDGKWVVRHCETVPGNSFVLDPTKIPPLTVAAFVAQDIDLAVVVEIENATWWPAPPFIAVVV